jgi:aryl-alcohol dehydrogenase-like predicted oxidoreductase
MSPGPGVSWTSAWTSNGLSREVLGKVLVGRRNGLIVATKARFPMGHGPNDAGLSRAHLIEACGASLKRPRTDHIGLYQIHEWDGVTPLEESMGAQGMGYIGRQTVPAGT